jgi:alpha-L-fucosidase
MTKKTFIFVGLLIAVMLLIVMESFAGRRILFIGDSVTDGGWGNSAGSAKPTSERNLWDQNHIYGHSYMMLCAAHYQSERPDMNVEFLNRGISGDDLSRLEKRWEEDVIRLHPDVLSLLVGTNDIHYYLQAHEEKPFDFAGWEKRYRDLLDRARKQNPKVELLLGTPFVAKVGKIGKADDYAMRDSLIAQLDTIVCHIAHDYNATLLRNDLLFAGLKGEKSHWIWDGIHPTAAGHQRMADLWISQCDKNDLLTARNERRVTISVTDDDLERYPEGPFEADWQSLVNNYEVPEWFRDAKFGIFIHWGLYSVPAAGSEWYPKHMYNAMSREHQRKWGKLNEFGYKDFIPLFKAEKFNAQEWAELFREAGARYVIPTAEHHDGFAMYDTKYSKWNAKQMGPCRDVIGELAEAVRHEGLKFGVSNHRIENWDFMYPLNIPKDSTDLFLPEYAGLYGPPQKPTEQSGMGPKAQAAAKAGVTEAVIDESAQEGRHPQSDAFLNEWEMRVHELIDKYQPDLLYFDNGINYRSLDPWKLRIARYYYNSAWQWGKQVSIQSKSTAYLAGSIKDFERESRAPKQLTNYYWQVDDPIGNKFGYIEGLKLQSADGIIRNLVENISKNGNLCLNVSPRSDGTIPDDQQQVLRAVGQWLKVNGEGVYGTRAWKVYGEQNIRFTLKDNNLYVFVLRWDGKPFTISSLHASDVRKVTSLYDGKRVKTTAQPDGLCIEANGTATASAVCFRVELN